LKQHVDRSLRTALISAFTILVKMRGNIQVHTINSPFGKLRVCDAAIQRRWFSVPLVVLAILAIASLFPLGPVLHAQDKSTVAVETQAESSLAVTSTRADSTISPAGGIIDSTGAFVKDSSAHLPETYGVFDPGRGYEVAKSPIGDLWISAYAVWRYVNQLPAKQTFTDHLGREFAIDTRNDLNWHRIMVHFRGFAYTPKLTYVITVWNVLSTMDMYIIGSLNYSFSRHFNLSVGLDAVPGTRSLLGSHPLWLANDRVMSDDFIRSGFSSGISANGEIVPTFFYKVVVNNNLSQIGLKASQFTRDVAFGGTLWWMPTTGEFGPRGAYGDWESHEKLATRFGVCASGMHNEDRYAPLTTPTPGSTQIRLADSRLLFETGALADGVTVEKAAFKILSFDAGFKYHGFFFQTEFSNRWLNNFQADGPLPVSEIVDKTFYIQTAFFPVPKTLELYVATSHIYGDKRAGFWHSYEYLGGLNFYPFDQRYFRVNAQVISVYKSSASSTFGFYVGGQTGTILSVATSLFF
jgi:hypothetical protein